MATRSGINPGFEMDLYAPNEQRIIRNFSRYFYVTRSMKPILVGNATYRAFLIRPTEEIAIVMNIDREIIALFANYENFEARTLKAFDDVYMKFQGDSRIDQSLRFLISGDYNIESIMRNFLTQNPDYPVVIPYNYNDVMTYNPEIIISKIRSNHLIRDLFGFQSPLKNEYFFFGRDRLVGDVIDLHRSGQNCGIFGLRKSGKTSTIYAIQRKLRNFGSISVVLDCQDTAIHARKYNGVLEYIANEVGRAAGARTSNLDFGDDPGVVSDKFREYMLRYTSQCRSNILIIFDEIENISPRTASSVHWREGLDSLYLWQILRSFFQSEKKYNVSFCFVGTNPSLLEDSQLCGTSNPIYLFAKKIFIPNLDPLDTDNMVKRLGYFMGIDFPNQVVAYLQQRYGGHPFFIRQICSKIHYMLRLNRPISASIQVCKEAESASSGDIRRYVNDILDSLRQFYPAESLTQKLVALGEVA